MHDAKTFRALIRPTPEAKSRAKELRAQLSEPERMLVWAIRSDQRTGLRFRVQEPIGPYIADFYCHRARLVIEIDGRHHQNEQHEHDTHRDDWMQRVGIVTTRIPAREVFSNLQGVYNTMLAQATRRIASLESKSL